MGLIKLSVTLQENQVGYEQSMENWAKALGDKSGKSDKADYIAIIRTFIFLQLRNTNCFIVAGNIRH